MMGVRLTGCAVVALALGIGLWEAPQARAQAAAGTDAATQQYAVATALHNREQYELAADEWSKFLETHAKDARAPLARLYLGVCQYKLQQFAKAADTLDKLIVEVPKFDKLETAHLWLGMAQFDLGKSGQKPLLDKAAATLAALTTKFPQGEYVPRALYFQGETAYAQGKKAEAAKFYEQLVAKHPKDSLVPDAMYALGVTQEELGQAAAADATYASFLKSFPQHELAAEVDMRRGETLLAQGKIEDAERRFAEAAARPGFALADYALLRQADCLNQRKQFAKAAALYYSLPQTFPKSAHAAVAWLQSGKCAYLDGQYPAAKGALIKAQELGGEGATEAVHWLARCLLKEQQPAEALKALASLGKQAQSGPFAVRLELDRADALYEVLASRKDAIAAYAALADKHPDDKLAPEALYMAGFASLGQNDYAAADKYAGQFLKKYASDPLAADVKYVAAESRLLDKKFAEAATLYADLLKNHPQHRDADTWKVRRALALFRERNYKDTVAALAETAASLGTPELASEARYLLGASYVELKQYDAAIQTLAAGLKADPKGRNSDESMLALAQAYRQSNQLPAARAELEKLIATFPESRTLDRANFRLGEYAYAAGDFPAAAKAYGVVLEKHSASALVPHARYGLAWTQYSQQDYPAAAKSFDQVLGKNTPSELAGPALYARALARQQLKQYAPAVDDLQAFLKTNVTPTEKSDARYVLGLCQAGLEKPEGAVATFRQLLKDDPQYAGNDKVLFELGWTLRGQGKSAEAAEAFEKLATTRADSPLVGEAQYNAGELHYATGEFHKAALAYHQAMQKAGDKNDLRETATHKLGWAYYRDNEFEDARKTFAYQRAQFPKGELFSDAAFMEAESLFKQDKFKESLDVYAQVKQPKRPEVAALALLHAGQAAGQLKDWKQSLALLERAAKEHPESDLLPEMLYEQGWAKQNLGQNDEALKLYETVTAKGGDQEAAARARFMIGEIFFAKKDHTEAVRNYFKVAYGYGYPGLQAAAQYEAGRCFEVLGKKEQARQSYKEVVEKHPKSDQATQAKERLAALGG